VDWVCSPCVPLVSPPRPFREADEEGTELMGNYSGKDVIRVQP